jgi:hypothetical protein
MKKCTFYNDHVTCATLMLDDLSLTAISADNKIYPSSDWGYALKSNNSLYTYLENILLTKYPEIKGTFFFLIKGQGFLTHHSGYDILSRDVDEKMRDFICHAEDRFELAFHGTTHGKFTDSHSVSSEKWLQEFEYLQPQHTDQIRDDIKEAEKVLNVTFSGGKYPGYKKNKYSHHIVEDLGFKWWCSDSSMMNKKHPHNRHRYFGKYNKILDFPTNLSGSLFNTTLHKPLSFKNKLRPLKRRWNCLKGEYFIQYLYENQLIISIQEHHCCLRTDGLRQPINIFDDIDSLDKIYSILRGADIWYAKCSEIAHYLESYDFTEIKKHKNQTFEITYQGVWERPLLSIKTKSRQLKDLTKGKIIQGIYRQGMWIYNNIEQGLYQEL